MPDESNSAVPDRALVLDAALRELHGRVETLARDSDDGRDVAAARQLRAETTPMTKEEAVA
jgi:hypothetical protein